MDELIRKLIRKYKTNDPFELAGCLNITVWFCDLGRNTRGMYYRKLRRRYIVIHENLDERWQRFVCAHELAHDRLHPGFSRFWLDEQSFFHPGKFERQANKFAIRLLTAGDRLRLHESVADFLKRNDIPEEMVKFYM
ncbi:zinc peptidase [Paenibacillus sp. 32O-W]|jgi:Predicted Zn peptidase|uniref:ImmA/IrrE family metallo-endopeptidase n=1 Tax=Paenibacillus cisolokensis TaxID=1658519 RepID=A0ABQ4N1R1_9BACL|nr:MULTISPECIES: ImmA/IrrE family metallo-endopeptidase [Paenibacillus]ALS25498.1 zinc peptidase [Paenibacillus sp. 32O-W]GIQ62115.1 ImmA/IrrE family metallo-endopeptidase [Paenibacillus cisolokensis]